MSLPTWTPAAPPLRPAARRPCLALSRSAHQVSTLKLMDSLAEQAALEDILEATKPPVPAECRHLDYLLPTPFRYRPYPEGSRFRPAGLRPGSGMGRAPGDRVGRDGLLPLPLLRRVPRNTLSGRPRRVHGVFGEWQPRCARPDLGPARRRPGELDELSTIVPARISPTQRARSGSRSSFTHRSATRRAREPCRARLPRLCAPQPVERQTWRIRISRTGAQALREHPRLGVRISTLDAFAPDPRLNGMVWERPRAG